MGDGLAALVLPGHVDGGGRAANRYSNPQRGPRASAPPPASKRTADRDGSNCRDFCGKCCSESVSLSSGIAARAVSRPCAKIIPRIGTLGKPSRWNQQIGCEPHPRPSRPLRETVKGTSTFANYPLRFLRPLRFLKALLVPGRHGGIMWANSLKKSKKDQDLLTIDLRHTNRKKPSWSAPSKPAHRALVSNALRAKDVVQDRISHLALLVGRCAAQAANSRMPRVRNHKTRLSCAFQLSGGFPVLERSLMSSAIWAAICVTFVSRSSPSITNRAAPIYGSNDSAAPGFLLL